MKKYLLFIPLFVAGFYICRFLIFVPKNYWKPEPKCISNLSFDFSKKGTAHLLKLNESLEGRSTEDYRYFFKTFLEEEKIYMVVNFRNQHECFDIKMLVEKWDKLTGMRHANGKSYPKELHDLEWSIENGEIIYQDMHPIID